MGYTHGKRGGPPKPQPPRYIEDRVASLEKAVAGLLTLVGSSLDREQADTQHALSEILLKKKLYKAEKKKTILSRALKKPVKRQRVARTRL